MGEAGLGTKRQDCEPVFDGVVLPATPTTLFFFLISLFYFLSLSLTLFIFQQQQKEMKIWDMGGNVQK